MGEEHEYSNEYMFINRIAKIQEVIKKYGEENFAISFSGGKDSSVVSALIDVALPGNNIPRVYCNTGVEYFDMVKHVNRLMEIDSRIVMVRPEIPVIPFLKEYGYPFKSKTFSQAWESYHNGNRGWAEKYKNQEYKGWDRRCPNALLYLFDDEPDIDFKISDKCCLYMKEKPINEWMRSHRKKYAITGIRAAEGGRRENAKCEAFRNGVFNKFNPLAICSDEFVDYCIDYMNVPLCRLYMPPLSLQRTGCKGCPFAVDLQAELGLLKDINYTEYKHCEYLWKPVYSEYRRIGYRLPKRLVFDGCDDVSNEFENMKAEDYKKFIEDSEHG